MTTFELITIAIVITVILSGLVLSIAMLHEYRLYLEDNRWVRHSIVDFIKHGQFYIFLFLGFALIMAEALLVCAFAE